jgi:hypothetical protein
MAWLSGIVFKNQVLLIYSLRISLPPPPPTTKHSGCAPVTGCNFWGAFSKLRKATISFLMSACPPSVRPCVCLIVRVEQLVSHWTDFHVILYLSIFRKSVEKFQVWLKYDKNHGYFAWRRMYIYNHLTQFFVEWEMFQKNVVEKVKTHSILRNSRNTNKCTIL